MAKLWSMCCQRKCAHANLTACLPLCGGGAWPWSQWTCWPPPTSLTWDATLGSMESLKRIAAASNLFQKDPELRGRKKICGDGTVVKTSQKSRHVVPRDGEESHRGLANRPGTAESITDICPTSGLKTPRSVLLEGRFHTGALETETGLL